MGDRRYFFLYPLSILFHVVTGIRNFLFNRGFLTSVKFDLAVICIGNITVGGTGKTPHTEYLISLLRKEFKLAVLSRGYKRRSAGFQIASSVSTVAEIGDEARQVSNKFPDTLVAVDRDRVNGVRMILKDYPDTRVIILDDGFQHRRIRPGLSILLTDYDRLITNDFLMPYGNLRESRKNISRADLIVVTKTPFDLPDETRDNIKSELKIHPPQKIFFTTIRYKEPFPLFEDKLHPGTVNPVGFNYDGGVVLITGIAIPKPLITYIEGHFNEVIHLRFPDHHNYNETDIVKMKEAWESLKSPFRYVITTEKDAVRLKEVSDLDNGLKRVFYYIPIEIDFHGNDKFEFDHYILEYVRKN